MWIYKSIFLGVGRGHGEAEADDLVLRPYTQLQTMLHTDRQVQDLNNEEKTMLHFSCQGNGE